MTKRVVKILGAILGLLLLVYFCYQIYMIAYPSYKTQVALVTTVSDSMELQGMVVRDETVVENGSGAVVNYLVSDGDKVALGAAVAEIYGSKEAAQNSLRIATLQKELDILSAAAEYGRTSGTNISSVRTRVGEQIAALNSSIAGEDYTGLVAERAELLTLLDSFATQAGRTIDYSARISQLQSDIDACKQADFTAASTVHAPVDGFFISYTDGFEDRINIDMLRTMAPAELSALVSEAYDGLSVDKTYCKIVSDYKWNYAAVVTAAQAAKFTVGSKYSVDFSYALVRGLPMYVTYVSQPDGSGNCVVVFECNRLNPSITALRSEKAVVDFTSYTGIRVPRSALRLVDGVAGVYIKYGATVKFMKVDILYEGGDFIISREDTADDTLLGIYDEMITEGKDIYEGKDLGNG